MDNQKRQKPVDDDLPWNEESWSEEDWEEDLEDEDEEEDDPALQEREREEMRESLEEWALSPC